MRFGQLHLFEHPAGRSEKQIVDEVVDRLGQIGELCGFTEHLGWTRIGGLAHDKVMHSMELMASKVMPQMRGVGAAASLTSS